ncbi:MAG: hypothetical protein VYA34_09410 [Myxococcota bacterium]|nr:hypothetical protein [Myxococcota bacterium]
MHQLDKQKTFFPNKHPWITGCFLGIIMVFTSGVGIASPPTQSSLPLVNVGQNSSVDTNNHVNIRIGVTSASTNRRPEICLEARVWGDFSVEACGTGSGILHKDLGSEIAHFRAKWATQKWVLEHSTLHSQLGVGFAELQIGEDESGFAFGSAPRGIETAGPEISASVQWWFPLGAGIELGVDTTLGAAYFHHAPKLKKPHYPLIPFIDVSAGVGW